MSSALPALEPALMAMLLELVLAPSQWNVILAPEDGSITVGAHWLQG